MAITKLSSKDTSKLKFSGLGKTNVRKSGQSEHAQRAETHTASFQDELRVFSSSVSQGNAVNIINRDGSIDETVLVALQDKIHETGATLLTKPGYNTVLEYRNAVQSLLKSVIPHIHEKELILAPKRIGNEMRDRKFTIVTQINNKLDTLLKLVVSSQTEQMHIMQALDEIKGLVINLLQ